MKLSVIIPSKSAINASACVRAIQENDDPGITVIIVDDGLPRNLFEWNPPTLVRGVKPFVFARNVNIGIREARPDDDVILLNDDALLQTPAGFSEMQRVARQHPEYGIISAACNNVGNPNQQPRRIGLREDPRMVCFVCVLIPRRTIETVGLLDERYVGYGMDDDDYSLRVRQAGLKIGIFDGCFVDHSKLPSSYRSSGSGDFLPNLRLFIEKWGVDNWGNSKENSQFRECFPA